MKSKKRLTVIVICALVIAAALAVVHLATRTDVPAHAIRVESGENITFIDLEKISTGRITGTVVNGKGEEKTVDAEGILLSRLLQEAGTEVPRSVTVVADDEYSVVVLAEEIAEPDKVCLLVEDTEGRLVVFGDPDSKRNVKNVVRIVVD